MDSRLVICKNSRCVMFRHVMDTDRKRCGVCDSKLKNYDYKTDEVDRPPESRLPSNAVTTAEFKDRTPTAVHEPPNSGLLLSSGKDGERPITFEADCDIEGCPVAPTAAVHIPWSLYCTWVYLAKKFDVEWIAYLRGTEKYGVITLDENGMYFPMQVAHKAHVDAETCSVLEGTIASIHSHVAMNAYFSKEDADHFNHPVDMVVNRYGDIAAVARRQLDCKRFSRVKAGIMFTGAVANVGAVKSLKEKLTVDNKSIIKVEKEFYRGHPGVYSATEPLYTGKGQHGVVTRPLAPSTLTIVDKRHHAGTAVTPIQLIADTVENPYGAYGLWNGKAWEDVRRYEDKSKD